jgi:hypothetical protein
VTFSIELREKFVALKIIKYKKKGRSEIDDISLRGSKLQEELEQFKPKANRRNEIIKLGKTKTVKHWREAKK